MKTTIVDTHNKKTTSGMKTVLVCSAPMGKSTADLIGCGFLFTENGAPISACKKYSIDGKLEKVSVEFPIGTDNDIVEFRPEKLAAFTVVHVEDKGFFLGFRVHLVDKALEAASLYDRKGDTEFHLVVRPLQMNLDEQKDADAKKETKKRKGKHPDLVVTATAEDAPGSDSTDPADSSPFNEPEISKYAKGKITAIVTVQPSEGGFAVGWEWKAKFRHGAGMAEPIGLNSPVLSSESLARAHGASELLTSARLAGAVPRSEGESLMIVDFKEWLETLIKFPGMGTKGGAQASAGVR